MTFLDSSQTMPASPGGKTAMRDEIKPFTLSLVFMLHGVSVVDGPAIKASEFLFPQMFLVINNLISQSFLFRHVYFRDVISRLSLKFITPFLMQLVSFLG